MPDGIGFVGDLRRHIGQTVTIFTTSGGESGRGFTGVLVLVNCSFVRLVTQLGSAPGCALGSCCDREREMRRRRPRRRIERENEFIEEELEQERFERDEREEIEERFDCTGRTLGSIVDIPVDRIASFVHNSIGSDGWV